MLKYAGNQAAYEESKSELTLQVGDHSQANSNTARKDWLSETVKFIVDPPKDVTYQPGMCILRLS